MSGNEVTKGDKIVFWGTCSFFLLFISLVISAYTRFHLFPRRYVNQYNIDLIYQPRWNVFVKNTDQPIYNTYQVVNGKLNRIDIRPFCRNYWYGINRRFKLYAIETDIIAADTVLIHQLNRYYLNIPDTANLNNYISPDTLRFSDIKNENVNYMSGKYILTVEPPANYEKARKHIISNKTITILPVNILH